MNKVDFHARENEIVGLIGPNGAGRMTLFNAITSVYPPTSVSIRFRGRDISGMLPSKVTKLGIARTFQNTRLFNEMTALENLMVGQHCRNAHLALEISSRGYALETGGVTLTDEASALLRSPHVREAYLGAY